MSIRFVPCGLALACSLLLATTASPASLRFYGNGVDAPDLDRVKIPIDEVGNSDPGPPADIGAGDFTIEFWLKASSAENTSGAVSCGDNIAWINGNVVVDRDRFSQGRKFGLSIAGGRFVFGVSTDAADRTVCGSTNVLDGFWHHVAVTRKAVSGDLAIWVDGALDGDTTGPVGDLSYPDDGVPCSNCCGGGNCNGSDPFLVLGAEKHDAGASYPSYSGFLDELRLSDSVRYASPFAAPAAPFVTDASTVALYHFDEGSGDLVADSSAAVGGPSDGDRRYGGSPAGPDWSSDTPFGSPDDLDADGKLNTADECTVLLSSQRFSKTKVDVKGLTSGAGAQSLAFKGEFRPAAGPEVQPHMRGLHIRLADDAGAVFEADVPGGLVGAHPSTPCDPRDGWSQAGSSTKATYLYRNYSGFLDAACSVSAAGISQIKVTDLTQVAAARVRVQVKASRTTIEVDAPLLSFEAAVAFAARAMPGEASAEAQAGGCGDYSWDPVTFSSPAPYCKLTPSPSAPTKMQCKTP